MFSLLSVSKACDQLLIPLYRGLHNPVQIEVTGGTRTGDSVNIIYGFMNNFCFCLRLARLLHSVLSVFVLSGLLRIIKTTEGDDEGRIVSLYSNAVFYTARVLILYYY